MLKVFKFTTYLWKSNRIQIKIFKWTSKWTSKGPHMNLYGVPVVNPLNTLLPRFLSSPPLWPSNHNRITIYTCVMLILKGNCGTRCRMCYMFSILAFTFFFRALSARNFGPYVWDSVFFNLIFTFFFKHFLQGLIGLRCSMVTFVYLIFTFFLSNFCKELRTSGVGWFTWFYFVSTFIFEHFLQRTISVGWLHVLISSLPSFLNTFCQEL